MTKRTKEQKRSGRKKRKRIPIIYLILEGEQTEKKYFDHFRRRYCNVQVITMPSDFKAADDLTGKVRRTLGDSSYYPAEGDAIWCVFDCDDNTDAMLSRAEKTASEEGYSIAFSNPCFELWYLLHFTDRVTPIEQSADAVELLDHKDRIPGYSKNTDYYEKLLPHRGKAIARAERLLGRLGQDHVKLLSRASNPATNISDLVQYLEKRVGDQ